MSLGRVLVRLLTFQILQKRSGNLTGVTPQIRLVIAVVVVAVVVVAVVFVVAAAVVVVVSFINVVAGGGLIFCF